MGWAFGHQRAVVHGRQRPSTNSSGVQRRMQKLLVFLTCCSLTLLQSCTRVTEQSVSETTNGAFKVVVRTQEISHSGTRNVDVCVANASSAGFPDKKVQCFLSGYDFDGLSVKWHGPRVIEVSFSSGRVARFSNSAFVYPGGPVPEEFHTLLCDGCGSTTPSKPESGAVNSLR